MNWFRRFELQKWRRGWWRKLVTLVIGVANSSRVMATEMTKQVIPSRTFAELIVTYTTTHLTNEQATTGCRTSFNLDFN
ncbi:hypothetical protein B0I37DRAFT_160660 [Chaetomium sp. MPI-CAGE-AT-0009]|nr:hypothetical protein B0I37DRAFT_160660 [Chaetomium sp. MPI-CAGE-AT-0009]